MQKIFLSVLVMYCSLMTHISSATVETDTHAYIVLKDENRILSIDRNTGVETSIKTGKSPVSLVIEGNIGYVPNMGSGSVSVVDLKKQKVSKTITIGDFRNCFPSSIFIDGDFAYVTNFVGENVAVVNLKTDKVVKEIPVGMNPNESFFYNGSLYILNLSSKSISVIDLKNQVVTETITLRDASSLSKMVHHGDYVYLLHYGMTVYDLKTRSVVKTFRLSGITKDMVIHESGAEAYLTFFGGDSISVIDLLTLQEKNSLFLEPQHPAGFFVAKGQYGYASNTLDNTVAVFNLESASRLPLMDHFTLNDKNGSSLPLNVTDTDIYAGSTKLRSLYPTSRLIETMRHMDRLFEYVSLNPQVFTSYFQPDENSLKTFVKDPKSYLELFQNIWEGKYYWAQLMVNNFYLHKDPLITELVGRARALCCDVRPTPSTSSTSTAVPSTPPAVVHKPIVVEVKSSESKDKKKAKKKAKKAKAKAKKDKAKKTKAGVAVSSSSSAKIDVKKPAVKKDEDIKKKSKEKKSKDKKAPLSKPLKAI